MLDEWRTILYPLGFLSGIAFGARFIVQWIQSEKEGKTVVPCSFWQLSLIGNLLLALHAFIQIQYPICVVQTCNAVISWRNLNLMQKKRDPIAFKTVVWLLFLTLVTTSLIFMIQGLILTESQENWIRIPNAPWQSKTLLTIPFAWHLLGIFGYLLFSSRFWIQWWLSELKGESTLPPSFWWLSLIGALFSIAYFIRIYDFVNLVGPLVGLVPYIRNLMLMQHLKQTARS